MTSQKLIPGIGLVALAAISAASIALSLKAQSDGDRVEHIVEVLNRTSQLRLQVQGAETAARDYTLSGDRRILDEYRQFTDRTAGVSRELKAMISDGPAQTQSLAKTEPALLRRFEMIQQWTELHDKGDAIGIAAAFAGPEGRAVMASVLGSLDEFAAGERQLLLTRSRQSQWTETALLAVDLLSTALIFFLAATFIRAGRLESRQQETALRATEAAKALLETTVADRTDRLHAMNADLERSTSVLISTFTSMAEAVLVIDRGGSIVLSNVAAGKLLDHRPGVTLQQLLAQNIEYRLDSSTPLAPRETPAARALRGEQFDGLEIIVGQNDGRDPLYLVVSGRALKNESGAITGAALVMHDITATREIERKLHQAQKLDAIGKLTGGIAHDFNNMLTVIAGTTETLVVELEDRPDLQDVAALIDQAAGRCAELTRHLLAFARKQPLQPRNVDINDTVRDIGKLLKPTLGEHIEIEFMLKNTVARSHIDPSQLTSALLNMSINARDAMPDGGKLMLETGEVVLDEAYARDNPEVDPGRYVTIAVSDTGTGMSPEVRDRVFEPFFTTKGVGKGSGLGLSMVYGFVRQSGGHIKVYSEVGHGTTIRLYLPPASKEAETSIAPPVPIVGGTETILVVEDDMLVRNFVISTLHGLGYKTIAAGDGRSALTHVDGNARFDLLLTDVIMPGGMTGRQLADEVLKRRPGSRILYSSGYPENAIVHHGRLDRGVKLLTKPYRKSELARMVREALEVGHIQPVPCGQAAPQ